MENPRSLLPILGFTNLGRTLLGEKGTKSPVGLRWTWARFWTVNIPQHRSETNPNRSSQEQAWTRAMQEYKREHTQDKDLSRGSARHKGLLTSTLLRKPQSLRTTKVNFCFTPITLGSRWRLSTSFTEGNTNTLELPQIGLESFQEPLSV
jgi:hypothetical protein